MQQSHEELKKYSVVSVKHYKTEAKNVSETIRRISNADCVLIGLSTKITKKVFEECKNIKYIGLCRTSLANADLKEAKRRSVTVSNVVDYGDESTAECIFLQLLSLARGVGKYRWESEPTELFGKTIGIVGLGAVGKQVARLALGFNMNVLYNSRTRKYDFEKVGVKYTSLKELIKKSEIISLHVPKNTRVLSKREFAGIPKGTILVNTCLGKVFDDKDFASWIKKENNFAIFDFSVSKDYYKNFENFKNVVFPRVIGGLTIESKERLRTKFLENLTAYLKNKSTKRRKN